MSEIKEVSEKDFNKSFWSKFNEKCIKCKLDCKQSNKVLVECSKFEEVKK